MNEFKNFILNRMADLNDDSFPKDGIMVAPIVFYFSTIRFEFSIVRDEFLRIMIKDHSTKVGSGTSAKMKELAKSLVEVLNCSILDESHSRIENRIRLEIDYPVPVSMKTAYCNLKTSSWRNQLGNTRDVLDKRFKFERWARNIERFKIAKKLKDLK